MNDLSTDTAGPASLPARTDGKDRLLAGPTHDDLAARMAEFYREVDAAVAAHKPTCWNRGACCKFGRFGHRLFVTDLELAYFVQGQRASPRPVTGDACPYQIDGLCTAREHRPLGCRIFFCDETAQDWQGPEYERFLGRLKRIGSELGVPYHYREWLSALQETETGAQSASATISGPRSAGTYSPEAVDGRKLPVIQ